MDLLEPDDAPLTVHEDIISYLKEQDLLHENNGEFLQTITSFTEDRIRDILEELLQKFEKIQKIKDDYANRVKAHNQYPLFNLKDILPDFEINEEMYKKITFRETLIIQNLRGEEHEIRAEPVGGLCLDIQQALGQQPLKRNGEEIGDRLARIMKKEKTSVLNVKDINIVNDPKVETDELYLEDSLEVQAKRNTDKLLVHLSSQFDYNNCNAGSMITSWVDKNLHTIEESRKEFYTVDISTEQDDSDTINQEHNLKTNTKATSKLQGDSFKISKETSLKLGKTQSSKMTPEQSSTKDIKKSKDGVGDSKISNQNKSVEMPSKRNSIQTPRGKSSRTSTGSRSKELRKGQLKVSNSSTIDLEKKQYHSSLQVIEEKNDRKNTRETLTLPTRKLIEKTLYVGLQKKYYYVKHISTEEGIDDRKFYSLLKANGYISEGANFILQRYLAITIYIGSFELSTMYINGDMCRNIYNCTGPESEIINDRRVDVCRIYRTVIEECGLEHKCMTILTLSGQIVYQSWEGIPYELKINPLLDIGDYALIGNERVLLKHAWENDMQLLSKYLDEKVATDLKIKSYMIDHPEFRNMINDYIHTILLLKPEDIIEFTINHFLSFAPQFLPENDYFN